MTAASLPGRRRPWADSRGASAGVIRATGRPRPASSRTVAIERPGCTAGLAAPIDASPIRATATSRSSTLSTSPHSVGRAVGQPGPFDDLDDQPAATDAVEPLADLADLAHPLERGARGVGDRPARALRASRWPRRRGRARWRRPGARRTPGRPAATTSVGTPSIDVTCVGDARQRPPDEARRGMPGSMRMPVPNSGTVPSTTVRPIRCHGSIGPPTVSHSTRAIRPCHAGRGRSARRGTSGRRPARRPAWRPACRRRGPPDPPGTAGSVARRHRPDDADCSSAAILRACSGSTRVSPSAVVNSVAG